MRRWVWSRNVKNEEGVTRVGSQRHSKKKKKNKLEKLLHLVGWFIWITFELFLGKQRRFILQLPNSLKVNWKGDLNEELYSMCKKAVVYWQFVSHLLKRLAKNRTGLPRIGLAYTNTVEYNTLTSLLQLSVRFHEFYGAIFYQHRLHFRVQLETTLIVMYLFWEHK